MLIGRFLLETAHAMSSGGEEHHHDGEESCVLVQSTMQPSSVQFKVKGLPWCARVVTLNDKYLHST
jgi:hypothetical protein